MPVIGFLRTPRLLPPAMAIVLWLLQGCAYPPAEVVGVTVDSEPLTITEADRGYRGEMVRLDMLHGTNLRHLRIGNVVLYDYQWPHGNQAKYPIVVTEGAVSFRIPHDLAEGGQRILVERKDTGYRLAVVARTDVSPWVKASVGDRGTCGVKADGSLWCWGEDFPPGDGWRLPSAVTPIRVAPDQQWSDVSVGAHRVCAMDVAGGHHCWGRNVDGRIGADEPSRLLTPHPLSTKWQTLRLQGGNLCGITDTGTIDCVDGLSARPAFVSADPDWTAFTSSGSHACATDDQGRAWCSGMNLFGQLGNGVTDSTDGFVAVAEEGPWALLAAGADRMRYTHGFTCGAKDAGGVWCWGFDNVQDAEPLYNPHPQFIEGTEGTWEMLSAAHRRWCGIQEGRLLCHLERWSEVRPLRHGDRWRGVDVGTYGLCAWTDIGKLHCGGSYPGGSFGMREVDLR